MFFIQCAKICLAISQFSSLAGKDSIDFSLCSGYLPNFSWGCLELTLLAESAEDSIIDAVVFLLHSFPSFQRLSVCPHFTITKKQIAMVGDVL